MQSYKYLSFITGIFTATLLVSNILDAKIFALGPLDLPSGIILFPLAYIFGDVLTEVYGYAASRKVIWTGFIGLLLLIVATKVAIMLPPAEIWDRQQAFQDTLAPLPRIAIASVLAYLVGEFCNSYIVAKIKVRMAGRAMPFRFVISTIFGQAADTTVFVLIAYAGGYGVRELLSIIISGWAFKVAWEIIALPITLPVVSYLKKAEKEDFFDLNTNFNPFQFNHTDRGNPRVASAAP